MCGVHTKEGKRLRRSRQSIPNSFTAHDVEHLANNIGGHFWMEDHRDRRDVVFKAELTGIELKKMSLQSGGDIAFIQLAFRDTHHSRFKASRPHFRWSAHSHFHVMQIYATSFQLAWENELPVFISRHIGDVVIIRLFRPGEPTPDE